MYDTLLGTTPDTVLPNPSPDEIISVAYYTLDGKRTKSQSGIYIKVVYYRDGHSSARKVVRP